MLKATGATGRSERVGGTDIPVTLSHEERFDAGIQSKKNTIESDTHIRFVAILSGSIRANFLHKHECIVKCFLRDSYYYAADLSRVCIHLFLQAVQATAQGFQNMMNRLRVGRESFEVTLLSHRKKDERC